MQKVVFLQKRRIFCKKSFFAKKLVNLIGKNGVGYFEYYLAKKFKPKEIVTDLVKKLLNSDKDTFVLYDHPLILKFIEKELKDKYGKEDTPKTNS